MNDFMLVVKLAWPAKALAVPGVLLVGIGSALQCVVTASKVLRSLAEDKVVPGLAAAGVDERTGRRAVILTCFLAMPFLVVPELEYLAIFVTMCFLVSARWVVYFLSSALFTRPPTPNSSTTARQI